MLNLNLFTLSKVSLNLKIKDSEIHHFVVIFSFNQFIFTDIKIEINDY